MTIVRVGATKKYSEGWESAFGKGKKGAAVAARPAAAAKKAKASAKKKSPAKKGKKK